MSAYAERRSIMDKDFMPPVSIEKFAAYLDGNLSEDEMNRIDTLVSTNPDMEELVAISDEVDEDIQIYMQDEFAYEADMTAFEDSDFDIPNLDADIPPHIGNDNPENREVACVADAAGDITDIDDPHLLNDEDETVEDEFESDEFLRHKDEDTISNINVNNEGNAHEPSDFPLDDDFLSS